jgi:competence protein ComEC
MKMRKYWIVLTCMVVLALMISYGVHSLAATNSNIEVAFINVRQGDSILIRDSGGFDVLIDGGNTWAGDEVLAYLRQVGVDDIDVMVATHPHIDHYGGLIDVLEADDIPVKKVLYNGYPGDTTTWNNFVAAVANEGLSLEVAQYPMSYTWGEMSAYILNPDPGVANPENKENELSVVVLIDHGGVEFLLTGDMTSEVENTVAARGAPYWTGVTCCAEILKVAHHGSATSTSAAFLALVAPDEGVISVGPNSYGHPADVTLQRLLAAGVSIWRTDECGTTRVVSNGTTYQISSEFCGSTELYLPLVLQMHPSPTPTEPLPTTDDIVIADIFFDGVVSSQEPDEYVEIRNAGTNAVQLKGWKLRDNANIEFRFPEFLMAPGQVCRIYTNEEHPEWCRFNYGRGTAIWTNSGDCATLVDKYGKMVDQYCY